MIQAPSQGANLLVWPREDQWFLPTVSWPTFLFRPECHIWTTVFINFQNQVCPPPPKEGQWGARQTISSEILPTLTETEAQKKGVHEPALEKPLISQEEGLAAAERP